MMTFKKMPRFALSFALSAGSLSLATVLLTTGCSTVNKVLDNDTAIDYKSSQPAHKLEVPPDLHQFKTSDRYVWNAAAVPVVGTSATANFSTTNNAVLPSNSVAHLERVGNTRYLVINLPAEHVYPALVAFWQDAGFTLAVDSPQTGIIETDWAQNRRKIPASGLRNLLGGVVDGLFDSGERDQFRTRLERVGNTTEIYLAHRGTQEVAAANRSTAEIETIRRDGSRELESEFLKRMMLRFGTSEANAKAAITTAFAPTVPVNAANAPNTPAPKARLLTGQNALELDDGYDMAWRRVGLALDRSGFTTLERNATTGEVLIAYAKNTNTAEPGFFTKLFQRTPKAGETPSAANTLKLILRHATPTTLVLQTATGGAVDADIANNMLGVLLEELK